MLGWGWLFGKRLARILPAKRPGGIESSRFRSSPGQFLCGVNLPWLSYGNDFGSSHWQPEGGVASAAGKERLEKVFAELAARGIPCVRWFLFADGRAGIRTDSSGIPLELDERVFADLDQALAMAERFSVQILFVLFDFHLGGGPREYRGVQLGGRSQWIGDPDQRHALLSRVIEPLLGRYGQCPAILGWDLFNEPEWITYGLGGRDPVHAVFPWQLRGFLNELRQRVHHLTVHPATVGLTTIRGLPLVVGIGLDLYQVHWYDRFERKHPLDRPVARLRLGRPLLLGEYPTRNSFREPGEIVDTARRNGYAGAFSWSMLGVDEASAETPGIEPVVPIKTV